MDSLKIKLDGVVGQEITLESVNAQLESLIPDQSITLEVNSGGGSVFEGWAIYNRLKDLANEGHAIHANISFAASIMSLIVLAAQTRAMHEDTSLFMIHNPFVLTAGDSQELRKTADLLDKIKNGAVALYQKITGLDPESISILMNEETWLDAEEALQMGFITEIAESSATKAIQNVTEMMDSSGVSYDAARMEAKLSKSIEFHSLKEATSTLRRFGMSRSQSEAFIHSIKQVIKPVSIDDSNRVGEWVDALSEFDLFKFDK